MLPQNFLFKLLHISKSSRSLFFGIALTSLSLSHTEATSSDFGTSPELVVLFAGKTSHLLPAHPMAGPYMDRANHPATGTPVDGPPEFSPPGTPSKKDEGNGNAEDCLFPVGGC